MNNDITYLVVATLYAVLILGLTFLSLFTIYVLSRYGKSLGVVFIISIVYAIIFVSLLISSFATLQSLS